MKKPNRIIDNEWLFDRLLCLERKRTERTGEPFVLMILDITALNGSAPAQKIAEICTAIRAETRDTDLCGWYQFPSAIGTIFTSLKSADRAEIQSTLAQKTERALRRVLQPAELKRVLVSFHFFPEEVDGSKLSFKTDDRLYPDLKSRDSSRTAYRVLKRAIDILGSLFGLILFSPPLLLIPLLIKFTSKGPVLFRQKRIGKLGKEFIFLKFRTMYINSSPEIHQQYVRNLILQQTKTEQESKPVYKIVDDPRVTPFGHFLRRTSLDELPQFFNVLKGDMSLVGPRPPIPYEVMCYRSWHRRRVIEVKPGITGLWQVHGRSSTTFDEMVRLDLRYVREQSIWLDLKIILKTPLVVLTAHGAY